MKRTTHNRPKQHRVLNAASAKLMAIILPIVAVTLGCAKKQDPRQLAVFPATGKITFNGKVPEGAYIALHPKDATLAKDSKFIAPRASAKPDGSFSLSSYAGDDGAPIGTYTATLEWHKTIKGPNGDPDLGPNLLPVQYSKAETSPVVITIAEGKNELPPIVLK